MKIGTRVVRLRGEVLGQVEGGTAASAECYVGDSAGAIKSAAELWAWVTAIGAGATEARSGNDIAAPDAPVLRRADEILLQIEKNAAWDTRGDARETARCDAVHVRLVEELLRTAPGHLGEVDERVRRGKEFLAWRGQAYRLGRQYGRSHARIDELLREVAATRPARLVDRVRKQVEAGAAAHDRKLSTQAAQRAGQPLTHVRAGALEHGIGQLEAHPAWTLVIDETGSLWDDHAIELTPEERRLLGRVVAVLIPWVDGVPVLPPQPPGWHAVDLPTGEIDRVVQLVLDAPVGVLGLDATQAPAAGDAQRWGISVLELLHWVLRLLPLAGPTRIVVEVEQRGEHQAGANWRIALDEILRQVASENPERVASLSVDVQLVGKRDSVFGAYADAIAFTWGSPAPASQARLTASRLLGPCLIDAPAPAVRQLGTLLRAADRVPGDVWRALVSSPAALRADGVVFDHLVRLARRAQDDPALWHSLLGATQAHLESKAVDLSALTREIEWLEACAPEGEQLPATLELAWGSARLSTANHLGAISVEGLGRLRDLARRHRDEDLRASCEFELRRAVLATNSFAFDRQGEILQPWLNESVEALGLRCWGRVRSSWGQHLAFTGQLEPARTAFSDAIAAFERLSDRAVAAGESRHTAAYLAIVLMDDPAADRDTALGALERVVGRWPAALEQLAPDSGDSVKYAHHLVVRWLAARGRPDEIAAYVALRDSWSVGVGHPWPLIEAWRGVMLERSGQVPLAREHMARGHRLALGSDQGPTVRLIGAAIAAAATALGIPWERRDEELDELAAELPAAAGRIELLRGPVVSAPALLTAVLPFNFR